MQQAKSEQKMLEYNAELKEAAAKQKTEEMTEQLFRQQTRKREAIASQNAQWAAAGIAADTGTPLEVMAETASRMDVAALDQALQTQSDIRALNQSAAIDHTKAKASKRALPLAIGSSVASGGLELAEIIP